jgi:periplasmic protein TonB
MLPQQIIKSYPHNNCVNPWQKSNFSLQNLQRLGLAFLAAVIFNILLFSLPAILGNLRVESLTLLPDNAINFVRMRPETPPPEKPKQKKIEEKKQEVIKPNLEKPELSTQKPDIKPPELSFDINPRLQMGMKVAAPAAIKPIPLQTEFEMGDVDTTPMPTMKLNPVYPYRAKRTHTTGAVDVRFLVDTTGTVRSLEILKAIPPGIFEDSVRQAITRWKFQPGRKDGKTVSTWMVTTINFELN